MISLGKAVFFFCGGFVTAGVTVNFGKDDIPGDRMLCFEFLQPRSTAKGDII